MDRFKNFFHGIYGIDALSCGLLFLSILINVLTAVIPVPALQRLNPIGLIPLLICILRFFSHNHTRRARENERFLRMMQPVFEYFDRKSEEREQAQIFRFFKCPSCGQKIRVPRGKGKIEITCPKCGNKFIKKT
ncbi:MAG: hypothetical protein KH268_06420 [Clostridiales bacterium]|uniref:Zn-finger containing protein n=1 Tax=Candidatus Anaerobutyricum stercoripullorum TaxID=2838456 RepID=A0A9D1X423_9FIRM|nr:hypothetical protein [Clostridiales bacterium]HIX72076.1 hypothetical protein [Candidatus Anaerobutyricum stercoripullorum]